MNNVERNVIPLDSSQLPELNRLSSMIKSDSHHPALSSLNLSRETLEYFSIGYSESDGSPKVTSPAQDYLGRIVGYFRLPVTQGSGAKRLIDLRSEFECDAINPRLVLYNRNRLSLGGDVFVTESIPTAWILHENGISRVVALNRESCSASQVSQILDVARPSATIIIVTDSSAIAMSLLADAALYRRCRWISPAIILGQPLSDLPRDCFWHLSNM